MSSSSDDRARLTREAHAVNPLLCDERCGCQPRPVYASTPVKRSVEVTASRATVIVGDKFRTPTGVWKVIETKPGGRVELFCKERASFQSRLHREVRTWERVL